MSHSGHGRGLLLLALAVSAIYVFVRVAPVYVAKVEFEEYLSRIASKAGAQNWPDYAIKNEITRLANEQGFQIRPDDIRITRSSPLSSVPKITIEVNYQRVLKFPGYVHSFDFSASRSTIIGRL